MLLFTLVASSPRVVDPKNTLGKLSKYLELINTRREVGFEAALNASFARNASPSHLLPSLDRHTWEPMNVTSFSFGETLGEWFAFKAALPLPAKFDPSVHFLHFDFVIDKRYLVRRWDDDTPAGPEGRIWLNQVPIAAVDEFHSGCRIDRLGPVELRIFSGRCRSSHSVARFGVSVIHTDCEALYHHLRFLISIVTDMKTDNPDRATLLRILDDTIRMLDIRDLAFPVALPPARAHDPSGTAFYASVPAALAHLNRELAKLPKPTAADAGISVIGYSHIDTCWLWPFSLSRFKFANTVAGMLHLVWRGGWKFLATSAQHYKWLKDDAPELYDGVLRAIRDGRWDANGATWVEPDTTLPSGESLVRQLTTGVRFFESELGVKQTVVFLPDCFGFSGNLPQIIRKAGIDSFVTAKISWCEYTQFPHSTFVWRGIDGSELLTHFITTPSVWSHQMSTYTGTSTAFELLGTLKAYKQKEILPTAALHTSGNGDGGGGVTEEMDWNLRLFAELPKLQDVPRVVFPTLDEVFRDIRARKDELPVWDDELYLEYHRGTLTTQEEVKRQNRQLEAHLHNVEWLLAILSSVCRVNVSRYVASVGRIWEDTLLFHFHDAVPGSSVNEANQDIVSRGRPLLAILRSLEAEVADMICDRMRTATSESATVIFNTLGYPRKISGQVVPSGGWTVKDGDVQIRIDKQTTTTYERIPKDESFEIHYINESFIETTVASGHVSVNADKRAVTTRFLEIQLNENGTFGSIRDLKTGHEYLSGAGNQFELYEDRPLAWPAWDIQLYHKEMQLESPVLESMKFESDCIHLNYRIASIGEGTETSTILQTVTFSSDSPSVDFKTVVNWTQHDKLLKVAFPTAIRSRTARFGIQFGHIKRPTHMNTKRDLAKFEAAGRWVDLSETTNGVSLCSDVKAGFDVHEGIIRMSLLKAPLQTDKWADFGVRKFSYRAVFHRGGFENSNIVKHSDELVVPVVVRDYRQPTEPIDDGAIPMTSEFVSVDDDAVVLETMKPAFDHDGFVCRFYEASGGWRRTRVTFPLLASPEWDVEIVDLLERSINGSVQKVGAGQLMFEFALKAFELTTVLLTRRNDDTSSL
jgi:alpha-mannosidase